MSVQIPPAQFIQSSLFASPLDGGVIGIALSPSLRKNNTRSRIAGREDALSYLNWTNNKPLLCVLIACACGFLDTTA